MVILFALGMLLAGSGVTTKKHSINEIFAGIGVALFAALNGYIESLVFLVPSRILERETEGSKEMALQAVGVQSQAGGTAMARVFQQIQIAASSGGKQLETFVRVTGLSVEAFQELAETET